MNIEGWELVALLREIFYYWMKFCPIFSRSFLFLVVCRSIAGTSGRPPSRGRRRSSSRPAGLRRCPRCDTGTSSGHVMPAASVLLRCVASQTPPRRWRCSAAPLAGRGAVLTDAACWTCSWASWEKKQEGHTGVLLLNDSFYYERALWRTGNKNFSSKIKYKNVHFVKISKLSFLWRHAHLGWLMTACSASISSSVVRQLKSRTMAAPRRLRRARLSGWSANSGIPTSGTAWYTASYRPLVPPCVTNALVLGWPEWEETLGFYCERIVLH